MHKLNYKTYMNRTFVRFFYYHLTQLWNLKIILKKLADSIGLEPIKRVTAHSLANCCLTIRLTVRKQLAQFKEIRIKQ